MKNLKNKLFVIFSLLCALGLTSCMDLYDGHEVPTTYKITFVGNGGATAEGSASYNQFIDVGKEAKLTKVQFKRENYSFVGWSLEEKATTTKYVDEEKVALTGDITLYARWQSTVCTVTFNSNDGTGNKDTQTVGINEPTKLKANAFSRTGFIFAGWSLDESAASTTYIDQQTVTLTNDLSLWARWLPSTTTITFDGNGGSVNGAGVVTSYTQAMETNVPKALEKNTFRKTGQLFKGWALSASATEIVYSDGSTYTPAGDVTLYAIWADVKANYKISYKNVDGTDFTDWTLGYTVPTSYSVDIDPSSATYGKVTTPVSLPTISNISRTDKFFAGWYSTNTYSGNAWTEVSGFASGDLTFYPKWSEVGLYVAGTGHSSATEDGNDSSGTGASNKPFATLGKAVQSIGESGNLDWVIYIDGVVSGNAGISNLSVKSLTIKGVTGNSVDVLDGNASGSTVSVSSNGASNIIFENITIRNGSGTNDGSGNLQGGGIYVGIAAKVTLSTGAVISGNSATSGGGVYVASGGTLNITDGSIGISGAANTAKQGGGVYNTGTLNMSGGSIQYNVCSYINSSSNNAGEGGGVYNASGTFTMTNGSITKNQAGTVTSNNRGACGGGIYNASGATVVIGDSGHIPIIGQTISTPTEALDNCANYSNNYGGGIYNEGTLTLSNNYSVTGNYGDTGGGIYTTNTVVYDNLKVTGNKAHSNDDYYQR